MISPVTDWPARLRQRLYRQYRLSNFGPLLAVSIGAEANELNATQIALLSLYSLDPITDEPTSPAYGIGRGVQLDRIGALVGQGRAGLTDDVYRLALRARVLVNRSTGSPDQIIGIALAMFAGEGVPLYIGGWIAQYTIRFVGVAVDPLTVPVILGLIGQATQAGVRAVVEWLPVGFDFGMICDAVGASQAMSDPDNSIYHGLMAGAASAT